MIADARTLVALLLMFAVVIAGQAVSRRLLERTIDVELVIEVAR